MKSATKLLTMLLSLVVLTFALAACSDKSEKGSDTNDKALKEETVKTFLLYEETNTSEEMGSIGNLYMKSFDSESEKIAGNVLNNNFEFNASNETVLFLTEESDLYEYKKGKDKEKLASNVNYFTGLLSDKYIFYKNDENDLYIIDESRESEKIASAVSDFDLIDSSLYYLDDDGDLNVYDIESRKESAIGSDIFDFNLLNYDGDLTYLNDDFMLFYKKNGEDAIRISSKEVNSAFINQLDDSFVYLATDDDDQVLYQTTADGEETVKIASDVGSYSIYKDNIIYMTFDGNLFTKKPGDESALKLASDVSYFTLSDKLVIYTDTENKVYSTTLKGDKKEKATYAETLRIAQDNSIIYENDKDELFINDKKIATGVDSYALFNNHVAYATMDNKLYFSEDLGEPTVIEEDLSKFSTVTYQNEVIFSNYLTFDDIQGNWKISADGQTGYVKIDKDGTMSNRLYGTTLVFEVVSSGYNYMEVMYDGEYGTFRLDGDLLTLEDAYDYMTLERVSKEEMDDALASDTEASDEATVSDGSSVSQLADATLDTVPFPGSMNTVESARTQIGYLIEGYLESYVDLDTDYLDIYIYNQTSLYSSQIDYMNSLAERRVDLYLDDYTFLDMKLISPTNFSVTTSESYTIDNPEKGLSEVTQTTKYTVELIDNEFYITDLEI